METNYYVQELKVSWITIEEFNYKNEEEAKKFFETEYGNLKTGIFRLIKTTVLCENT